MFLLIFATLIFSFIFLEQLFKIDDFSNSTNLELGLIFRYIFFKNVIKLYILMLFFIKTVVNPGILPSIMTMYPSTVFPAHR